MQDDTRSAYVSFAGHITDATNTYLLAVEVSSPYASVHFCSVAKIELGFGSCGVLHTT